MKNIIFFTLSFFAISFASTAQITITSDQIPVIGDTLEFDNALAPMGLSLGTPGASQIWDFTSLNEDLTTTQYYVDPNIDSSSLNFPTATVAILDDQGLTVQYAEVTNDEVLGLGFVSNDFFGFAITAVLDPPQTIFQIPTNYQDSYIDNSEAIVGVSQPTPDIDTARVVFSSTDTVSIDAYGILKLPNGDFEVLRREQKNETIISVEAFFGIFWLPILQDTTYATSYTFLSREAKRELASVTLDSTNTNIAAVLWQGNLTGMPITAPTADFACVDTSSTPGLVNFEDLSQNTPEEWLWDFGDGTTSTEQHPEHIYSEDLMVQVCLTVTNSGGSDQFCKTIDVNVGTQTPAWNDQWKIGPNPSTGNLVIDLGSSIKEGTEVLIYNQSSALIFQNYFTNNEFINISSLSSGNYLLAIRQDEKIIGTTKVQLLK